MDEDDLTTDQRILIMITQATYNDNNLFEICYLTERGILELKTRNTSNSNCNNQLMEWLPFQFKHNNSKQYNIVMIVNQIVCVVWSNIFLFPDEERNWTEFGSSERRCTRAPNHKQNQPPEYYEALPTSWEASLPARQHSNALWKGKLSWWWPKPYTTMDTQLAPEVWKVLGGDPNVCRVHWFPRSSQLSTWEKGSVLELSQDSGQGTVVELCLALVSNSCQQWLTLVLFPNRYNWFDKTKMCVFHLYSNICTHEGKALVRQAADLRLTMKYVTNNTNCFLSSNRTEDFGFANSSEKRGDARKKTWNNNRDI